jgi:hypothetical protein
MYEYYNFSPHNGITIAKILILLFSPVNDNFDLSWNYYFYYHYYCCCYYYCYHLFISTYL